MYKLSEQDLHQVVGCINGFEISIKFDVPIADTPALQVLLTDLLTGQLDAVSFAQVLMSMPSSFNDMNFVSILIEDY